MVRALPKHWRDQSGCGANLVVLLNMFRTGLCLWEEGNRVEEVLRVNVCRRFRSLEVRAVNEEVLISSVIANIVGIQSYQLQI